MGYVDYAISKGVANNKKDVSAMSDAELKAHFNSLTELAKVISRKRLGLICMQQAECQREAIKRNLVL